MRTYFPETRPSRAFRERLLHWATLRFGPRLYPLLGRRAVLRGLDKSPVWTIIDGVAEFAEGGPRLLLVVSDGRGGTTWVSRDALRVFG